MDFCYKFPVVKGIQAKKQYYIAMVPLKMLGKLFPDEEELLPEYRAQRRLNESRIPVISRYILENRDSYVFSALAASIDGNFEFVQSDKENLGVLEVALDARFLINDGQHRKAAILQALEESPELGEETISVVFYEDLGLENSQQMFTDLNKHAVKTSNSIAELYDSRDNLAVATREMVAKIAFFDNYVDKEKDILGKYSSSLFTLNNIYTANKRILSKSRCDETFEKFCFQYWSEICRNMVPWIELQEKRISKQELREKYIAAQAVVIQAFGRTGGYIYRSQDNIEQHVQKIQGIDWRRKAQCWYLRVIKENGRMINSERAIMLASNVIKKQMEIELTEEEQLAENQFNKANRK